MNEITATVVVVVAEVALWRSSVGLLASLTMDGVVLIRRTSPLPLPPRLEDKRTEYCRGKTWMGTCPTHIRACSPNKLGALVNNGE